MNSTKKFHSYTLNSIHYTLSPEWRIIAIFFSLYAVASSVQKLLENRPGSKF